MQRLQYQEKLQNLPDCTFSNSPIQSSVADFFIDQSMSQSQSLTPLTSETSPATMPTPFPQILQRVSSIQLPATAHKPSSINCSPHVLSKHLQKAFTWLFLRPQRPCRERNPCPKKKSQPDGRSLPRRKESRIRSGKGKWCSMRKKESGCRSGDTKGRIKTGRKTGLSRSMRRRRGMWRRRARSWEAREGERGWRRWGEMRGSRERMRGKIEKGEVVGKKRLTDRVCIWFMKEHPEALG